MKKFLFFLFILSFSFSLSASLKLAENGKTDYTIRVSEQATAVERYAASELAQYLGKMTGAEFRITDKANPKAICIGANFLGKYADGIGREGVVIRTDGNCLLIGGGTPDGRGTLYGVYEFLEQLGCRFLVPSKKIEFVPSKKTLEIDVMSIRQIPSFPAFRWVIADDADNIGGKSKLNGTCSGWSSPKGTAKKLPEKYGIVSDHLPFAFHTFSYFLPDAKYGKTHPEYYSLIGNKRFIDPYSQLCLSNEAMIAEFTGNVMKYLEKNYKPGMILVISQNDNSNFCQCEKCRAIVREEGTAVSGVLLRFVNQVAAEVAKKYPDLTVCTNAYHDTLKAPAKTYAASNVAVGICSTEMDIARGEETPYNAGFFREVRNWKDKVKTLYVDCDYGTTFDHHFLPLPNFDGLASRLRTMEKLGVKGYSILNTHTITGGGEFQHLRNYLTAKLAWNCDLALWSVVKDFCDHYYGPAGKAVYGYLREYHRVLLAKNAAYLYSRQPIGIYDEAFLSMSEKYFAEAFAEVKDNPVLTERIEREYVSVRYLEMIVRMSRVPGDPKLRKRVDELESVCKKFKISRFAEGGGTIDFFEQLRADVPVPDFCKGIPRTDWIVMRPDYWRGAAWVVPNVPDSRSPFGNVRQMNTNHTAWALYKRMAFLPGVDTDVRYSVYAHLRALPGRKASPESVFCLCGNEEAGGSGRRKLILAEASEKEYRYFKVAENVSPTLSGYIWMAPVGNPEEVQSFFVDYFLFVKESVKNHLGGGGNGK